MVESEPSGHDLVDVKGQALMGQLDDKMDSHGSTGALAGLKGLTSGEGQIQSPSQQSQNVIETEQDVHMSPEDISDAVNESQLTTKKELS